MQALQSSSLSSYSSLLLTTKGQHSSQTDNVGGIHFGHAKKKKSSTRPLTVEAF